MQEKVWFEGYFKSLLSFKTMFCNRNAHSCKFSLILLNYFFLQSCITDIQYVRGIFLYVSMNKVALVRLLTAKDYQMPGKEHISSLLTDSELLEKMGARLIQGSTTWAFVWSYWEILYNLNVTPGTWYSQPPFPSLANYLIGFINIFWITADFSKCLHLCRLNLYQ